MFRSLDQAANKPKQAERLAGRAREISDRLGGIENPDSIANPVGMLGGFFQLITSIVRRTLLAASSRFGCSRSVIGTNSRSPFRCKRAT
ncbi:MAG: hypothetical protein CMJ50_04295 [Planctomycetaceae bacterium]|nr:hypothetical protein [Planctomycetaceae bacterium]